MLALDMMNQRIELDGVENQSKSCIRFRVVTYVNIKKSFNSFQ